MRISALGAGLFVLTLGISARAANKAEPGAEEPEESTGSAKPADSGEPSDSEQAQPAKKKHKRAEAEEKGAPGEGDKSYSHGGQFGLRAAIVGGYRMIFRYEQSPFCTVPAGNKSDGAKGE